MTNAERAGAAQVALGWHAVEKDGEKPDMTVVGVLEEEMIDLLADLEHLAKQEGISFVGVLSMARRHVIEERAGR